MPKTMNDIFLLQYIFKSGNWKNGTLKGTEREKHFWRECNVCFNVTLSFHSIEKILFRSFQNSQASGNKSIISTVILNISYQS